MASKVLAILFALSFAQGASLAGSPSPGETQELTHELDRISAMDKSLAPGPVNDLVKYEIFVDEIQQKWKQRDKECFARLMVAACGPLSSGRFSSRRQYELAKRYAIFALENRNSISIPLELQLVGHVATRMSGPGAPKGEAFAECRRKDVEVRLHAWKRLTDALVPNWDPNDTPVINVVPPAATGLPGGIAPEAIKDPVLRAQYERAIESNRQKAEKYNQQHKLRLWLKTFPKNAEDYLIQAYSHPPCNAEELRKSLNEHKINENTKARILDAVTKNCDKSKK